MQRFPQFPRPILTVALVLGAAAFAFPILAAADPSSAVATGSPAATSAPQDDAVTPGGIALDASWKKTIFARARTRFVHPAWGWQHSERNYLLGLKLAMGDGLSVDRDVLFAAAFLHDMSAFDPQADPKIEHGDYAATASETILRDAGFPMEKYPRVAAAERTHMFYRDPGTAPESIVLHDADSLDFLGAIGAARLIALTGEKSPSYAPALKQLREFVTTIPPKLITRTGKRIGDDRARELRAYLDRLDAEDAVSQP